MVESGDRPGFALEAPSTSTVLSHVPRQYLEGESSSEVRVLCKVDHPHPAFSQPAQDHEAPDVLGSIVGQLGDGLVKTSRLDPWRCDHRRSGPILVQDLPMVAGP